MVATMFSMFSLRFPKTITSLMTKLSVGEKVQVKIACSRCAKIYDWEACSAADPQRPNLLVSKRCQQMIFLEQHEPELGLREGRVVRCDSVLIELIDAKSTGRAGVPKPQSFRVDNSRKFVYPGTTIYFCFVCVENHIEQNVPPSITLVFWCSGISPCTDHDYNMVLLICSGIKNQLEKLLQRADLVKYLWHFLDRPPHDPAVLEDVYDGAVFREFQDAGYFRRQDRYEIALQLNADGFQPFDQIAYSVTGIYAVVLNLPREIRFKDENVILVGLIPGIT
jgi:hypothetical protein